MAGFECGTREHILPGDLADDVLALWARLVDMQDGIPGHFEAFDGYVDRQVVGVIVDHKNGAQHVAAAAKVDW